MKGSFLALARKYRPKKLDELIGQEIFVSTIKNAINSNRTAHAYLLSGIRGVGKTTAARILAHLFNQENEVKGTPIDLQEVDSARYTGVDEMRELLDGIKYRPSNWKFKVYILDEVHMLSNSAVSSLLKVLEEPPDHVKFIFCTTEPRKIPATIISRCQRFDLKRIPFEVLAKHLQGIAIKEQSEINLEAAHLISKAADGSARDAISILDKSLSSGEKKITEKYVQDLLGLVDRSKIYSLFEKLIAGQPAEGLNIFNELYDSGADPGIIIQDLLDVVHWLSRVNITPEIINEPGTSEIDKNIGEKLAGKLNMAELSKTWQILLKGYQEIQNHDMPNVVAEMVLIRLSYASDLPTVDELTKDLMKQKNDKNIEKKQDNLEEKKEVNPLIVEKHPETNEIKPKPNNSDTVMEMKNTENILKEASISDTESKKETITKKNEIKVSNFKDIANLFLRNKELLLFNHLFSHVCLVNFKKGKLELNPIEDLPKDFASKVTTLLSEWTGERWIVSFSKQEGETTLEEQQEKEKKETIKQFMKEKRIQKILKVFPGATIDNIKKEGDIND